MNPSISEKIANTNANLITRAPSNKGIVIDHLIKEKEINREEAARMALEYCYEKNKSGIVLCGMTKEKNILDNIKIFTNS